MKAKLILKEISKKFHISKDKYSVHKKLTGYVDQLCQDKSFIHNAIHDCLVKKDFFYDANNLFFYLLVEGDVIVAINLFPPINDKAKDITVDNIHHHGWRLLTTGVISGNGYESINFKRKSHEDIEDNKVKIKIDKIFKHTKDCSQFIDSEQAHVVFHPETTTATLAIWSADRDLINQKFKNAIKNFPKTIKFTSDVIHQMKLNKIFGLNKKNNVHYIPRNKQIIFDPNPAKKNDGDIIEITKCILKFLQQINFNNYSFLKELENRIRPECKSTYNKLISGEPIPDIGIIGDNNRRFSKNEILESIKN